MSETGGKNGNIPTSANLQVNSLGVGATANGVQGTITSTGATSSTFNATVGGLFLQVAGTTYITIEAAFTLTGNRHIFNAGTDTAPGATVTSPTLGAAAQLSTTVDEMVYIDVTTAGQITIAIGPTSGVANTLFSDAVSAIGYTLRLPAGWYIAVTTSSTAVWTAKAIVC